jgi:thioredoxin reductase (NADPH)
MKIMNIYDVIIIGAGPAGLTAAIYTSRACLKTLIIQSPFIMSQAGYALLVENFPGFEQGVSGPQFIASLKTQVTSLGAELIAGDVGSVEFLKQQNYGVWQVNTSDKAYQALSQIVASGASTRKLGIPDEDRLLGKGLSYCATCDGAFFKDKEIAVIGGGNSAVEEAIFLTRFASKVTIVHRRDKLRATRFLQNTAHSNKRIDISWNSVVDKILGDSKVSGLRLKNLDTNTLRELRCEGVFVSIGKTPNTEFLKGAASLDNNGYIITDRELKASKKGLFACGDCRDTFLRQIVTACGDGALAAYSCQQYIEQLKGAVCN